MLVDSNGIRIEARKYTSSKNPVSHFAVFERAQQKQKGSRGMMKDFQDEHQKEEQFRVLEYV